MIFWMLGSIFSIIMLVTAGIRDVKVNIILGSAWLLLMTWVSFLITPVLSFAFPGVYVMALFSMLVGSFSRFIFNDFSSSDEDENLFNYPAGIWLFLPGLGLFLFGLFVTTSGMLHSSSYRSLLAVTDVEEFRSEDVFLDQTQARFVDQDLSARSASELLGKEIGLGSRYNIGTMRVQTIKGELTWVAPFEHKTLMRWLDNGTAPGYVTVNSSNYDDAKLVLDNVDINFGVDGFYFDSYVPRHLYKNGYKTVGFADYTLEIRDDGQPFWVASRIKKTIGFSGIVMDGVVTVNATTGEIADYAVNEAPDWIDRIQPDNLVFDRISDWGRFVGGWFNAYFVGNDVVVPTEGTLLVYTTDGRAMWYTGVQSDRSGNDNASQDGTMGFFLVDSRTGDAIFYRRSGITEKVAKTAMEGRVQEYGYTASSPIPYNVNGRSTFISILKDRNGNSQMVGLVAYDNRNLVAVGSTLQSAVRTYLSVLSASAGDNEVNAGTEQIQVTGTVDRLGFQSLNQQSVLYFTLAEPEHAGRIFSASSEAALGTVLTRSGDRVSLTVMSMDHREISVIGFENLSM